MRWLLAPLAALFLWTPAHAIPAGWTILGGCNPSVTKVVAFTSGPTATVPSDYCSLVEVDAIGAGGASGNGTAGSGGGAFEKLTSGTYTPGQSITIQVSSGAPTCWVSCATLAADYGRNAAGSSTPGVGGNVSNNVGTSGFSGGDGNVSQAGGGAAGPNGAGAAGVVGGTGGGGDNGHGGAGGGPSTAGGNGTEWSLSAGGSAGSGGGCGQAGSLATPGGNYGGGGCGGSPFPGGPGQGVIVLQYHPSN